MKSSRNAKTTLVAGIAGVHVLLGLVLYFLVLPLLLPAGAYGALPAVALAVTAAGLCVCLFCVFAARALAGDGGRLADFLDIVRIPFVILDAEGRYRLINAEAERALGLNRTSDAGAPASPDIRKALVGATAPDGTPDPRSIFRKGDAQYYVLDYSLSADGIAPGAGAGGRVVVFRDVSARARVNQALEELTGSIRIVADNTARISDTSVSVSQGANRQASSIAAISASLDEFSKRIQGNTESAEKGTKLAAQAREAAERSGGEIANALTAMTDVQEAGIRIARIVKLIDDIAFQTNLLALNAAVEAARAGRQGKGFAVVADEVRNLAGRSAKAAKDTASMVEDVTERIGNASVFITKLEDMLRNIVQDAIRMADSSASATAASAEQATAILQVNRELGQMNSVTQSTKTAAENSAGAVEQLAEQVRVLRERLEEVNLEFRQRAKGTEGAVRHAPAQGIAGAGGFGADFGVPDRTGASGHGHSSLPPPPSKIDLTGELPPYEAHGAFSGYTSSFAPRSDVDMDAFEEPFKKMAARDWGAVAGDADADASLPQQEIRTGDGDRIVKPGQNIKLDDAEFGRY